MAFGDLTQQEQEDLMTADTYIRGVVSSVTQAIDLEMQWWQEVIDPIMAQLNNPDVIPNSTNLAGSQDLTKAELQGIKDWVKTSMADMINTNIALVVKAVGINAPQGEQAGG